MDAEALAERLFAILTATYYDEKAPLLELVEELDLETAHEMVLLAAAQVKGLLLGLEAKYPADAPLLPRLIDVWNNWDATP